MEEVKWIKLCTDVFDNRKIRQIESLPSGDTLIVIWFKILTLAGVINDGGAIYFTKDIPYTDQILATAFNRPLATVQTALSVFQKFGMISITDSVIQVSNWEKYQNIEGLDKIREQTRKRVAKHREKQKLLAAADECNVTGNATVTQSNAAEEDIEEDKEEERKERNTLTGIEKESTQKSKRLSLEEAKQAVLNSDLTTDLIDSLLLWLEYKYLDRKDKYAERGMTQLISSARACAKEYGALPAARIVKYSIEREWQGVLWEKAKDYADKPAPKAYEHGSVFYRAAKTLSKRVSDRLGLPEDSEETKQAWAAELETLSREMNIDPDGDMREALFFSQESDYWKGRVLDAKSFRRNFRQILSDMRRRDGA